MARPSKRTPAVEERFLAALRRGLSVGGAAAEAGVCVQTPYRWREADADFAARWHAAYEAGTDRLEDEALRRAVDGVDTPVYYGGEKVGDIRKYSDALLMFQLKGRRPEKYNKPIRAGYAGAEGGRPIETAYARLSDIERAQEVLRLLRHGGESAADVLKHRKNPEAQ